MEALLQNIEFASYHVTENVRNGGETNSGKEAWNLVQYASLLQQLITTPEDRELFSGHHDKFVGLFTECDSKNYGGDWNKHELCNLWAHVLKDSPEMMDWVVHNAYAEKVLMGFCISLRPNEESHHYNNTALPAYFQILNICCTREVFLDRLMEHSNFQWAVRYLFLEHGTGNYYYPAVANVIYEILKKCAAHERHRRKLLTDVLNSYVRPKFIFYRLAQFLENMLQTRSDVVFFNTHKGVLFLVQVSKITNSPRNLICLIVVCK